MPIRALLVNGELIYCEPPSAPANLPTEIVNNLNEATPEHLRDVARYAEALAEHKEQEARLEEDDGDIKERPDDPSNDVWGRRQLRLKRSTTIATTTGNDGIETK